MMSQISDKKVTVTLNLSESSFQYLEALAYALCVQDYGCNTPEMKKGYNKKRDDFKPLVTTMLESVCDRFSEGVTRPSSWERNVICSLTGWDETLYPKMFGNQVKIAKSLSELIDEKAANPGADISMYHSFETVGV